MVHNYNNVLPYSTNLSDSATFYKVNFYVVVFSLLVGVVLYDVICNYLHFTFTDEILVLFLFVYWIICGNKKEKCSSEFLMFGGISVFYLLHSLYNPHNVGEAIWMDYVIQIKPFVAFYTVMGLKIRVSTRYARSIRKICVVLAMLLLPIGILFVFQNSPLMFDLMGHPSRYATACQVLGVAYMTFSEKKTKNQWISFAIISISILSLRSKAYGFCALFFMFVYFRNKINVQHLFSWRNSAVMIVGTIIVLFFSWEKVDLYFIQGSENEYARPMLYSTGFEILKDYPFFGTGFGSYAEFASSVYYSPIYSEYGLVFVYGLSPEFGSFICDTYFPTLVQFGYIGVALFLLFWRLRIKDAQRKSLFDAELPIIIVAFFMIESIADSTLTHNRGIVMMMLLAINLNITQFKTSDELCTLVKNR